MYGHGNTEFAVTQIWKLSLPTEYVSFIKVMIHCMVLAKLFVVFDL